MIVRRRNNEQEKDRISGWSAWCVIDSQDDEQDMDRLYGQNF
eukprot:COSAG01_NODE_6485_length_3638_cov_43.071207_5_plen_42_part_00